MLFASSVWGCGDFRGDSDLTSISGGTFRPFGPDVGRYVLDTLIETLTPSFLGRYCDGDATRERVDVRMLPVVGVVGALACLGPHYA